MGLGSKVFLFLDRHSVYAILGLLVCVLCLAAWNIRLACRIRAIGSRVKNLAGGCGSQAALGAEPTEDLQKIVVATGRLNEKSEALEAAQRSSMQNVGLVRFDAFDDVGGEQSFALALLDAQGNGLVLSSLFGRSESRVYAKPISEGRSEHALSSEEQEAVKKALRS